MFKVFKRSEGSNIVHKPLEEVKKIRMESAPVAENSETYSGKREESSAQITSQEDQTLLTDVERRTKRKEEYREAASIRERALRMEREAKHKIEQTKQFSDLLSQAKEDPTVFAKVLNMDPSEFQRKIFNKAYSIKEDPQPQKEETFEEQTKRRLEQYEHEMSQDKERRVQEARQYVEVETQRIKHSYIQDKILPHINESHELIIVNDKQGCAERIYDMMNCLYQEHCNKGGNQDNFPFTPEDAINQMEEELEKRAEAQMLEARNIGKLKKYFNDSDEGYSMRKKDFSSSRSSPTISKSFGTSVPTSAIRSTDLGNYEKKIPLKNKNQRLMHLQKVLGSE